VLLQSSTAQASTFISSRSCSRDGVGRGLERGSASLDETESEAPRIPPDGLDDTARDDAPRIQRHPRLGRRGLGRHGLGQRPRTRPPQRRAVRDGGLERGPLNEAQSGTAASNAAPSKTRPGTAASNAAPSKTRSPGRRPRTRPREMASSGRDDVARSQRRLEHGPGQTRPGDEDEDASSSPQTLLSLFSLQFS
jgi:hypothetical protein